MPLSLTLSPLAGRGNFGQWCAVLSTLALLVFVASAPPQRNVYVGTYLSDVSDFELKEGHFKADLRVWVKWRGSADVPELTFENGEIDSKDDLGLEHDGDWHSAQWRVQGTFRGDFPVHAFPFDNQTLPVVFGLDEGDGLLVPDLGASGMSPEFSVTGWAYEPYFGARTEVKKYGSDLGSIAHEGKSARLRLASFEVEMHRPFGPYLIKFALPLSLILLMALLALFLPGDRIDVRSAMGITALLSCIAFHYTQADTLPDVTYLVAADKLFLGAYVFITGTFLCSVISFRLSLGDGSRAQRVDRYGIWLLPLTALVSSATLVAGALDSTIKPPPPLAESKPALPLLRVASTSLDSISGGGGGPSRRANLVVRGSDGITRAALAEEAPAMTNALVRLLPDGGMRVRWRLRDGAKWTDGAVITADDLAFSIGTTQDPRRKKVEKVDARTIDVTYDDRHGEYLEGFNVFPLRGQKLLVDAGREVLGRATNEKQLPSAGPYVSGEFVQGKQFTLMRNADYAGPRPVFDRVELVQKTPEEAAAALLAREVDVVPSLTSDSYELLKGKPGVTVLEQPGEQVWLLIPTLATAPWNSREARRALLHALDRDAMVKELEPVPARVASGWKDVSRKKVAAGPTLAELGITTLTLHIGQRRSRSSTQSLLAARVAEDLTKAGLTVTIEEHDQLRQFSQRDYDGLVLMSRDTDMAARFMGASYLDGVYRFDLPAGDYYDAAMVDAYDRYMGTLYDERRDQLEAHLQNLWFERLPMLPLVLTSRLAAVRSDLVGPDWGTADSIWWNLDQWSFAN